MKIAIISDDDSLVNNANVVSCDLVISCGDLFDRTILDFAERHKCKNIFAVKGNHDSSASFPDQIVDLHLKTEKFNGLNFGGFEGAWKYKPRGNYLYEQYEVTARMEKLGKVDVFVSHNSPRNIHDKDDEVHMGFEMFNYYVKQQQPHFHGHQHVNAETILGPTRVVGVFGVKLFEINPDHAN